MKKKTSSKREAILLFDRLNEVYDIHRRHRLPSLKNVLHHCREE